MFVRAEDLQAAIELGRNDGFFESEYLPTKFVAGLCKDHGYETLPCSGCSTGWDWLAKSDEAEKKKSPPVIRARFKGLARRSAGGDGHAPVA